VVTGQPAVDLCIFLFVAGDTKVHFEIHRFEAVKGGHGTVAFRAIQLAPIDVRFMAELDVIGYVKDAQPANGYLLVVVLPFLHDLRMGRNDVLMAEEAFFHGRDARVLGTIHEGMAEPAIDLFHPGMHAMAEIDGLLRAKVRLGIQGIEIEHDPHEQSQHPSPNDPLASGFILFALFSHPFSQRIRVFANTLEESLLSTSRASFPSEPQLTCLRFGNFSSL
jgi:hypothetical protein